MIWKYTTMDKFNHSLTTTPEEKLVSVMLISLRDVAALLRSLNQIFRSATLVTVAPDTP